MTNKLTTEWPQLKDLPEFRNTLKTLIVESLKIKAHRLNLDYGEGIWLELETPLNFAESSLRALLLARDTAPDHAREGALRERLLGEPLGDLSFSERLAEKMCNLLTDKFTNSVKIAAGIIKQELERALADGKEGGE